MLSTFIYHSPSLNSYIENETSHYNDSGFIVQRPKHKNKKINLGLGFFQLIRPKIISRFFHSFFSFFFQHDHCREVYHERRSKKEEYCQKKIRFFLERKKQPFRVKSLCLKILFVMKKKMFYFSSFVTKLSSGQKLSSITSNY